MFVSTSADLSPLHHAVVSSAQSLMERLMIPALALIALSCSSVLFSALLGHSRSAQHPLRCIWFHVYFCLIFLCCLRWSPTSYSQPACLCKHPRKSSLKHTLHHASRANPFPEPTLNYDVENVQVCNAQFHPTVPRRHQDCGQLWWWLPSSSFTQLAINE